MNIHISARMLLRKYGSRNIGSEVLRFFAVMLFKSKPIAQFNVRNIWSSLSLSCPSLQHLVIHPSNLAIESQTFTFSILVSSSYFFYAQQKITRLCVHSVYNDSNRQPASTNCSCSGCFRQGREGNKSHSCLTGYWTDFCARILHFLEPKAAATLCFLWGKLCACTG